jgi:hypothetical protein
MKLLDIVLIAIATALFMIGIHQSAYYGIKNSYWIFMISLGFMLVFRYRRAVATPTENNTDENLQVETNVTAKKGKKKKSKKSV